MQNEKKQINSFLAVSPLFFMAITAFVGVVMFKIDLKIVFILACAYACAVSFYRGYTYAEMEDVISEKVGKAVPAILIMIAIGIVIGTWIYSGTVPMMIYYGLKVINPQFFLPTAFIICAVLSVATGSSWSSAGTAGLALIGVAAHIGVPLPMAVGAVVAGASFGDKLSPLSETTNLAAVCAGTPLYSHIGSMLYTTIPAAIVGLVVYLIVGLSLGGSLEQSASMQDILANLESIYSWNLLLLLPAVLVLVGALKKLPGVPVMLASSVVALILGMVCHDFSFTEGITAAISGFKIETMTISGVDTSNLSASVVKLLNRGGLNSMTGLVVLTVLGNTFAALLNTSGGIDVIISFFERGANTDGKLIAGTLIGSLAMAISSGASYAGMIALGSALNPVYLKRKIDPCVLSRCLEDAGTMIVGLIPWATTGLYYIELFGISPFEFGIWAVPCYTGIIIALIYGFTGKCIKRIKD